MDMKKDRDEEPKFKKVVDGANDLSLGISIVAAILIGVGIGIGLKNLFGVNWVFWIGVVIGVGAAIRNIQIAYQKQKASLDALKDDPKYNRKYFDEDDKDY
jgi:F0F1-type ATP synthase assembly protein I